MTSDELIGMAEKAGFKRERTFTYGYPYTAYKANIERFAALVIEYDQKQYELNDESLESVQIEIPYIDKLIEAAVLTEREKCAKVCDGWPDYDVQGLAEAIRTRSDK